MNLDCDIIRDLLPSYIDDLTSEKSNVVIKEHLSTCIECQRVLTEMQQEAEPPIVSQDHKIDYLKTYKKRSRRNVYITALVFITLAAILCFELMIHFIPLSGATKSDLKDYSMYPVMEVSLSTLHDSAEKNNDILSYKVKWSDGNILQNTVVCWTYYSGSTSELLSSEQIDVSCNSIFFKQAGSSINIVDGIIYIQVTGYRKTIFYTSGAEQFGFAIKMLSD